MSRAITVIVIITFVLSIATSSGLLQFASAFVNIVLPSKGEPVPAGSSLEISGTSDDNVQTNCKIQVIVNDKRPYQETTTVGPGDYSKWIFIVTPQYGEIDEGINKITSKAICDAAHEPFLVLDPVTKQYVKHYSINVTGVPAGTGLDSEEPFVLPAPGEDLGNGGEEGTEGDAEGDGESTSDDSLFG
ncbi:hypothetical protein BH18THE2_BH18THE2_40650 [soil metagenome]